MICSSLLLATKYEAAWYCIQRITQFLFYLNIFNILYIIAFSLFSYIINLLYTHAFEYIYYFIFFIFLEYYALNRLPVRWPQSDLGCYVHLTMKYLNSYLSWTFMTSWWPYHKPGRKEIPRSISRSWLKSTIMWLMLSLALAFRDRRKAGAIVTLPTKETHKDTHGWARTHYTTRRRGEEQEEVRPCIQQTGQWLSRHTPSLTSATSKAIYYLKCWTTGSITFNNHNLSQRGVSITHLPNIMSRRCILTFHKVY